MSLNAAESKTAPPINVPRFSLGRVVATPGALSALERNGQSASDFLDRHHSSDWGEVCADDKQANDQAIEHGARLLSAYRLNDRTKIWVITEAERASTCILLPDEY